MSRHILHSYLALQQHLNFSIYPSAFLCYLIVAFALFMDSISFFRCAIYRQFVLVSLCYLWTVCPCLFALFMNSLSLSLCNIYGQFVLVSLRYLWTVCPCLFALFMEVCPCLFALFMDSLSFSLCAIYGQFVLVYLQCHLVKQTMLNPSKIKIVINLSIYKIKTQKMQLKLN